MSSQLANPSEHMVALLSFATSPNKSLRRAEARLFIIMRPGGGAPQLRGRKNAISINNGNALEDMFSTGRTVNLADAWTRPPQRECERRMSAQKHRVCGVSGLNSEASTCNKCPLETCLFWQPLSPCSERHGESKMVRQKARNANNALGAERAGFKDLAAKRPM